MWGGGPFRKASDCNDGEFECGRLEGVEIARHSEGAFRVIGST